MSLPKILIFTAVYDKKDYCLDEFIENCKTFTYNNYEHVFIDNTNDGGAYFESLKKRLEPLGKKVYRVERGNTTREALARAQNFARELCLKGDYDYLMSLESDIFPKKNIMERLIATGRPLITGLYMIGFDHDGTRTPCITIDWKNEKTGTYGSKLLPFENALDYMGKGIKEVAAGGMGCCIMHRGLLEKLGFTYMPGHKGHSDVFFFNDARKLGYKVYVDTDAFCEHKNSDWTLVTDR